MHENRETSEMPEAEDRGRPAGEGKSHTARVHVYEESDSGTVPMNHSIGIGATVTRRPLPHHRAYGSVHGGSSRLR